MTLAHEARQQDGSTPPERPDGDTAGGVVREGRSAARATGGLAADRWPGWARQQLQTAIRVAVEVGDAAWLTRTLYLEWFNPAVAGVQHFVRRGTAGRYRTAHAGSATRTLRDGVFTVDRHDVIGLDGWWRTWGEHWTPPRARRGSVRLLMTPLPGAVPEVIAAVTAALLPSTLPWALHCAIEPRRLRRTAAVVLYLPHPDALEDGLADSLAPLVAPHAPPLCLPVRPGLALAHYPDNGMSFGEHRCHLIATAMRRTGACEDPFDAIADVFTAHGIDPAHPYR